MLHHHKSLESQNILAPHHSFTENARAKILIRK